eukprot:TRINITY_DN27107_c0_g1_i1.p1 TRINITY_DN27107_c0_g1~~TRINITY_DN27107_c0_g1_i1.p1  ORF type:complete len:700 (+),score=129.87 TRINITY_DN27107_c0_g1_i1:48-2147(+)
MASMSDQCSRVRKFRLIGRLWPGLAVALFLGHLCPLALRAFCVQWSSSSLQRLRRMPIRARPGPARTSHAERKLAEKGFYRRPLRPARFETRPIDDVEGRGEWEGDGGRYNVNFRDPNLRSGYLDSKWEDPDADLYDDRRGGQADLPPAVPSWDGSPTNDEIWNLLIDREVARVERDYDEADRIQIKLRRAGIEVDDKQMRWRARSEDDGRVGLKPSYGDKKRVLQMPAKPGEAERAETRYAPRTRRKPQFDSDNLDWQAREEFWRPPAFLPKKQMSVQRDTQRDTREDTQRDKGRGPSAPVERRSVPPTEPSSRKRQTKLKPPAKPVNLQAMAEQGLPKVNLYQLEPEELDYYIIRELGLPRMRSNQVRHWIYEKGEKDFMKMDSIPVALREELSQLASIGAEDWQVLAEKESIDGTVKLAYGVPGGHAIESVLMPYNDGRRTACVSSQVGCAMGCVFCATGQMGFKRHLTSAEIFEQAARFSSRLRQQGLRLSSVVLLGMGEPLANFDNVVKAMRRINSELGIGMRHITISTVGLVPEIARLAQEKLPVTLAISLHAATDEERSALLPMNRRYPIKSVMEAAHDYFQVTGRRVSFEWTLIAGQNDTPESAQKLGRLISKFAPGSHVNLIPLNPTNGYNGGPSQREAIANFIEILNGFKVEATIRVRRGIDIDAGCGQLAERAAAEYLQVEEAQTVDR